MTEHKGATSKSQLDAARRKMRERLAQFPGESYTEGWSSLWKDKAPDDRLPWDRGFPNPGLEDTLLQKGALLGGPLTEGPEGRRRKKVLVPGCGTGVDVLLFASFGYDAYGLEYSQVAVDLCKTREAEDREKYVVRDAAIGRGNATFIQGDFFKEDWLEKLGLERNCFELIYDYTFFCALQPYLRPQWALRHAQLLAPSPIGKLICLEYPTTKDRLAQGPPYASPSNAYLAHLSHPGEDISYDSKGHVKMDPSQKASQRGFERVAHWQPERTHDGGKNESGEIEDRISIWRRLN